MPTLPSTKKTAPQGVDQNLPHGDQVATKPARKRLFGILQSSQTKPKEQGIMDILLADEPKIEDMMIPLRSEYSTTDRNVDLDD